MRYHRLDLNLVIVLDALLRLESVAKVAEELYLSAPAVSNALARLREHFDDELFVPNGRRMQPTAFATSLHEQAADMLAKARGIATARAGFEPAQAERHFSLAVSDYVAQSLLPRLLPKLRQEAPGVNLTIIAISEDSIMQFQRGDIDLLVAPEDIVPPGLQSRLLFEDRFVSVVSAQSDRAGTISAEAYFNAGHILAEPGTYALVVGGAARASRQIGELPGKLDQFFAKLSRERRIALRVPFFFLVPPALIGTELVATLPLRCVQDHPDAAHMKVLDCEVELPVLREYLHWAPRLAHDPGGKWLLNRIEEASSSTA